MFKSFLWVFMEKGAMMTIQFATLLVLSRLLTPTDYGIYGIMLIFISVSDILVDSGFGGAIIQKKELQQKDIDTLFISNLCIACVLYLGIYIFAGLIERFYDVTNLSSYLRVLGLAIIFFSLSIVQNSLMMRNLQFKKLAAITVSSSFLSSIIAILLAYYGFGVWALVLQQVLMSFFLASFLWIFSRIRVSWSFSKDSFKQLWAFGSNLLFANILSSVYNNISSSIVPKISTLSQSGYFNQARRLQVLPNNIISMSVDKAAFPILSKEQSIDQMKIQARTINRYVFTICFPLFPTLSLISFALVKILLGEEWIPASSYLTILFWSGYGLLIQSLYRNMFKSAGYTAVIFKIEILNTFVGLIILFSAIKGGILFLIYGIVLSSIISALFWCIYVIKKLSYSVKDQLIDLKSPFLLSITSYICCYLITATINEPTISSLLGGGCVFIYVTLGLLLNNKDIKHLLSRAIKLVKK